MAWKKWKSYIFPKENDTGLNYGPVRSNTVGIKATRDPTAPTKY